MVPIDGVKRTGALGSVMGAAWAAAGPKLTVTGRCATAQRNRLCRAAPDWIAKLAGSVAPAANAPAACLACCKDTCSGASQVVMATTPASARTHTLRRPRSAMEMPDEESESGCALP
ncbi:hypothetical protein OR16_30664 [Cupriavidus basilensis OR16]|uniref:Uncharacterized protein n=1 Tax=Cupriavidus basilensis OR16 TaxID=1127483 RepID=H1SD13_9BURK|nr:hypothetical protein OR16_30664 [Cupriavidus basilensis OR16]